MGWARDDAKLDRVRALMADEGLDALVVRAPDNVLYLSNFWGMKGYDAVVFPLEGEPVLVCLEASADDAARTAWTSDVRFLAGYAPDDRDRRARDGALPGRAPAGHEGERGGWHVERVRARRRHRVRGQGRARPRVFARL